MPGEDKIALLHKAASEHFDVGSIDDFKQKLQDPNKRKAFYDAASKQFDLGDYSSFEEKVLLKKKEPTTSPSALPSTQGAGSALSVSEGGISGLTNTQSESQNSTQPMYPNTIGMQNLDKSQDLFNKSFSLESSPQKKVDYSKEWKKAAKENKEEYRLPIGQAEENQAVKQAEIDIASKKQSDLSFGDRIIGKSNLVPKTETDKKKEAVESYRDPVYGKALTMFDPKVISGSEKNILNYLRNNDYLADKLYKGGLSESEQFDILRNANEDERKSTLSKIDSYKIAGIDKLTDEYIGLNDNKKHLIDRANLLSEDIINLKKEGNYLTSESSNSSLNKKIEEYNDIVGKVKDIDQEMIPYNQIKDKMSDYMNSLNDINNIGLRESNAINNLPKLKESIRLQRVAEGEEEGKKGEGEYSAIEDVGTKFVNSITKAAQEITAFAPKQLSNISKAITGKQEYGIGDRIADFITGNNENVPFIESSKYSDISKFNPLKEPGGFIRALSGGIAQQIPIMATMALTDVALSPSLASIGGGGNAIKAISASKKADAMSTVVSGYINSYKSYADQADKMGLDPRTGLAYASSMSAIEGLSELILPDKKILTPDVKSKMLKEYIVDLSKGIKPIDAAKKMTKGFVESGIKEYGEEFTVSLTDALSKKAISMDNPDIKAEASSINDQINTAIISFATGGFSGAIREKRGISTDKNLAYLTASRDLSTTKALINNLVDSGTITKKEAVNFIENVNKFNEKEVLLPHDLSDVKKADIIHEINKIDDVDKKTPDITSEPILKALENQKKEAQKKIDEIIGDGQYEIDFQKDVNENNKIEEKESTEAQNRLLADEEWMKSFEEKHLSKKTEEAKIQEPIKDVFSKAAQLFSDIKNTDGAAKKRKLANERKELMDANPSVKYIDDNIVNINKQLEEKGLIQKEGDCP